MTAGWYVNDGVGQRRTVDCLTQPSRFAIMWAPGKECRLVTDTSFNAE